MGVARVGTLHDFRRLEHKRGIADSEEGKKLVHHRIGHLVTGQGGSAGPTAEKDLRSLEEFGAIKVEEGVKFTLSNFTVMKPFESPDFYVYCLSHKHNPSMHAQFEGSDSVVQIASPKMFFTLLTESLTSLQPVRFLGLHAVSYQSKAEPWNGLDWGRHPALVKELRFAPQFELRAIWQPLHQQQIEPVVLGHRGLPGCCKLLEPTR